MYVCSCNPFNDKKVKDVLAQAGDEKTRIAEVYRHCSGGAKPQCCSCLPLIKDMVMEHNNAVTIKKMKDGLHNPAPSPASTAETEPEEAHAPKPAAPAPTQHPIAATTVKPGQPVI